MPVISTNDFLQIADRIAKQYEILVGLESQINPTAVQATATLLSSNAAFTLTALQTGTDGNNISIQLWEPDDATTSNEENVELWIETRTEEDITNIFVRLSTDGAGAVNITTAQLVDALNADCDVKEFVVVSLPSTSDGSGTPGDVGPTYLTGGINGSYAGVVTASQDVDVVSTLTEAANLADTQITTQNIVTLVPYWSNLLFALNNHFAGVSQSDGLTGYLSENSLRVHRDFDAVFNLTFANHMDSVYVFRPDVITLASNTLEVPAATQASLVYRWAATSFGSGNSAWMIYRRFANTSDTDTIVFNDTGSTAVVSYTSNTLTININTADTVDDLINEINTNATSRDEFYAVRFSGDGTGNLTDWTDATTALANSPVTLTFTAVDQGDSGNDLSVQLREPTGSGDLGITIGDHYPSGTIQVLLEHDGTTTQTTAAEMLSAWNADARALSYMTLAVTGETGAIIGGTDLTSGSPNQDFLYTGVQDQFVPGTNLGAGEGPTSTTNYAAQHLEVSVTPANRGAKVYVKPFLDPATVNILSGDNGIQFDAASLSGPEGAKVSIEYRDPGTTSASLVVTVENTYDVVVSLATDGGGAITSTANNIETAIDGVAEATALVDMTQLGTGNDVVIAVAQTYLVSEIENTSMRIDSDVSVLSDDGGDTNGYTIQLINPGGTLPLSITRTADDFDIQLETSGGVIQTTAAELKTHLSTTTENGYNAGELIVNHIDGSDGSGVLTASALLSFFGGTGPNLARNTEYVITCERADLTEVTRSVFFDVNDPPSTSKRVLLYDRDDISSGLVPALTGYTSGDITVSALTEISSLFAWQAFDQSTSTNWSSALSTPIPETPQWLQVDFGSGNAVVVGAYTITVPSAISLTDWTVQGSNDGTNWQDLNVQEDYASLVANQPTYFEITNRTAFRYYRLLIRKSGITAGISQFQLYQAEEFNSVSDVSVNDGTTEGEKGDAVAVTQIVERTIVA